MSVALDILETYRAPRAVFARRVGAVEREDRALAILMGACVLMFVAQWPRLSREAHLDATISFDARLAGALFGWLLLAPLFFYVLAWFTHLMMRVFGKSSTGYTTRLALFWALLAASPLWLLTGLTAGFVGPGAALTIVGSLATLAFFIFWVSGLLEIAAPSAARA